MTCAVDGGLVVRRGRRGRRGRADLLDRPAGAPVAELGHDGHDGAAGTARRLVFAAVTVGVLCGVAAGWSVPWAWLAGLTGVLSGMVAAGVVAAAGAAWCGVDLPVGNRAVASHRLAAPEARALCAAVRAARRVVGVWPELAGLVRPADPTAVLHRSLWELAGVLAEHGRLRVHHAELHRATGRLPAGAEAMRGELGHRLDQVADLLDRQARDVDARVGRLRRLADELAHSARDQRAVGAARELAAESDRILGAAAPTVPDEVGQLTDRTRAVLAAWRELTEPARLDGV